MVRFNSLWIQQSRFIMPPGNAVSPLVWYERPLILCLCGSTRFKYAWWENTKKATEHGFIVLGVGDLNPAVDGVDVPLPVATKKHLDYLHRRKIDLADMVLVLNVCQYVGESTLAEMQYAAIAGKEMYSLEHPANEHAKFFKGKLPFWSIKWIEAYQACEQRKAMEL